MICAKQLYHAACECFYDDTFICVTSDVFDVFVQGLKEYRDAQIEHGVNPVFTESILGQIQDMVEDCGCFTLDEEQISDLQDQFLSYIDFQAKFYHPLDVEFVKWL